MQEIFPICEQTFLPHFSAHMDISSVIFALKIDPCQLFLTCLAAGSSGLYKIRVQDGILANVKLVTLSHYFVIFIKRSLV